MKRWFQNIIQAIRRWGEGRYGHDSLGTFLIISSVLTLLLGYIPGMQFFAILAMIPLLWSVFRCFSRNTYKRRKELEGYMKIKKKITDRFKLIGHKWHDRKTHCYVKCKHCGAVLRVPKGKGEINIICPKCGKKTSKKT